MGWKRAGSFNRSQAKGLTSACTNAPRKRRLADLQAAGAQQFRFLAQKSCGAVPPQSRLKIMNFLEKSMTYASFFIGR